MLTCLACGQKLPNDAKFCGFCGFRLGPVPPVRPTDPVSRKGRIVPEPALSSDVDLGTANTVRVALEDLQAAPGTAPQQIRKFGRYPMCVEVTYSSAHNFFTGSALNICRGGLFVATVAPAHVGHLLQVRFTLPGLDRPCTAPCEVRWIRRPGEVPGAEPGMGLRFLYLDAATEGAIEAFVAHREPIILDT